VKSGDLLTIRRRRLRLACSQLRWISPRLPRARICSFTQFLTLVSRSSSPSRERWSVPDSPDLVLYLRPLANRRSLPIALPGTDVVSAL
jgi:hypothetical protein